MSYKTNDDYAVLKQKEYEAYSKYSTARDAAAKAEREWLDSMNTIDTWLAENATWQVFELIENQGKATEKKPLDIGTYDKCQEYLMDLRKARGGSLDITYRETGKRYLTLEVVESTAASTTVTRSKYLIEAL